MRGGSVLCVAFVFCFALVSCRPETSNVDDILSNRRLLQNYANCLLDKGKCSPQGQELKKILPEAIETNCAKCSEKDKENSAHVLGFLMKKEKEIYDELEKKYDPTGKYRETYLKEHPGS